jgi:hypothetical protein
VTAQSVQDQICQFFGGPYSSATHDYRSPQVAGLGQVRRAFPKREDQADFTLGQAGVANGCVMVVWLLDGDEKRIALAGAVDGRKEVRHVVQFHCFIRSTASYAEDAQDYAYGLLDGIRAHIHADRTCGSGGFENGAFQVGEGDAPRFTWHMEQGNTSEDVTEIYLLVSTDALEIVAA